MSNEWSTEPLEFPSKQDVEELSPSHKQLFIDNLKKFIEEETKSIHICDCDCHYNPGIMHMAECCHQTYVQYK